MSAGLIVVLAGAVTALALMVANIVIAAAKGNPSRKLTLAVYGAGIVTALLNLVRVVINSEVNTVVAANVVALFCIVISLRRALKGEKDPAEDTTE